MVNRQLKPSKMFDALQQRVLLGQNKGTTCITFIPYDMPLPYALQKIFKKWSCKSELSTRTCTLIPF